MASTSTLPSTVWILAANYRAENNHELNEAWPDGHGFLAIPTALYPILKQEKNSRKARVSLV